MDNDLQRTAEKFMSTADGKKLADKKEDIEKLASSKDGETVKAILQRGGFEDAVKSGDTDAIKSAISKVVSTDAGSRLLQQLQQMMGNQ
jgi:hypothetical protein